MASIRIRSASQAGESQPADVPGVVQLPLVGVDQAALAAGRGVHGERDPDVLVVLVGELDELRARAVPPRSVPFP